MGKLKLIYYMLVNFGIDPRKFFYSFRGFIPFILDYFKFKMQERHSNSKFNKTVLYPSLQDRYLESGVMTGHYFHQDLLVAKRIFTSRPLKHVDVGSRIDGFVAHVASFRIIEVFDIRSRNTSSHSIQFSQLDIMQELPKKFYDYCDSLSCLHTIEHFGLGRYGDQINYNGHLIGIENLSKILKPKGQLYLSLPIGSDEIYFNSHRIFSLCKILEIIGNYFIIENFNYVDDNGDLHENISLDSNGLKNSFNCNYGCGIFELIKK